MKKKNIIFLIILFPIVLFSVFSCREQKAEWRGTIEDESGVIVVRNPQEPMYEEVFNLEEDLSIGEAEGQPEYMFYDAISIAVDDKERIYILDRKEAHVKVFDQNGKYLKTIGRKGKGPGEFENPTVLKITNQNELVVEDFASRLAFFSLEGEFKRNLSTAKTRALRIDIDSEGNVIAIVIVREKDNPRYELRKFDSELNFLFSLGSSPLPSASRNGFNPFGPILLSDIKQNNQIVIGYPKKYEIKILDKDGNMIRKIIKEYNPVEITEEEIKEETEGMPQDMKLSIPKYHNAYRLFINDDEGRIFVQTFERVLDGEDYYCDVFDSEGRYIVKIPLKFFLKVIKKRKLYIIEEGEEGFQILKRYEVNWKI